MSDRRPGIQSEGTAKRLIDTLENPEKPERIQLIESMRQIDQEETTRRERRDERSRGACSEVTPSPFPGIIPIPGIIPSPFPGGRREGTAVPRRKGFTTRLRRETHRSLETLDVHDQPRRRVHDAVPPTPQEGSHMVDCCEPNSRVLVAEHGLSSRIQKWEPLGTEIRR